MTDAGEDGVRRGGRAAGVGGGGGGGGGPTRRNELSRLLTECGYAPTPARRDGEIRLQNCPFGALAAECQPLICEMNLDRKSTRLNSSHMSTSYAVFCLKKK